MGKLSIALYLIVILLLAWFAALPHWPTLQKEAAHIYAAWQQIRSSGSEKIEEAKPQTESSINIRERTIAAPKSPLLEAASTDKATEADMLDPFILEARERAQADPEAAMQWLQEQGTGESRLRGMLEVVALWAADDSESALLWLESNAQGLARLETLNNGVELWAERDPQAAASWIDGMANDGSKIVAAKSLAASWANSAPDKAAAWLDALPSGEIKNSASLALVEAWAESDPRAASIWALNQTQASGENSLLKKSLKEYTLQNPTEAEVFARQLAYQQSAASGMIAYVNARAEIDPADTADWLIALDPSDPIANSEHIGQYTQAAIATWTETDSIAASAWLSEQPLGAQRDAAIAGFSESIRRFEPEAAVAWAKTISNPAQRSEELTHSIRAWAKNDPQEALNWVIQAELEPALQEQLAREIGVD